MQRLRGAVMNGFENINENPAPYLDQCRGNFSQPSPVIPVAFPHLRVVDDIFADSV